MSTTAEIFANAIAIGEAGELTGACTSVQAGVTSVKRARVILYEVEKRTAAERGLNMMLAACFGEIARGDGGENPKLHSIAAEAMKPMGAAGGGIKEEERAMDAVLEATILFNWKCAGHNGMAILKDKQWLLIENATLFRAPREGDCPGRRGREANAALNRSDEADGSSRWRGQRGREGDGRRPRSHDPVQLEMRRPQRLDHFGGQAVAADGECYPVPHARNGVAFSISGHCLSFKMVMPLWPAHFQLNRIVASRVASIVGSSSLSPPPAAPIGFIASAAIKRRFGFSPPSPRAISLEHAASIMLRPRSAAVRFSTSYRITLARSTDVVITPACTEV